MKYSKENPNANFNITDIQLSFNYNILEFSTYFFFQVVLAWGLNVLCSLIIHRIIYCKTKKGINKQKITYNYKKKQRPILQSKIPLKNIFNKIRMLLILIFSPDLFWANIYKGKLKNYNLAIDIPPPLVIIDNDGIDVKNWNTIKILFQNFIIKSNWLNVCISIIITLVITIFIVWQTPVKIGIGILQFLFICVFIRLVSRGLEIALAFYKDVVKVDSKLFFEVKIEKNKAKDSNTYSIVAIQRTKYINGFKSSLLREGTRLSLAVHSLLELFITFGLAFFLLFNILSILDESYFFPTSNSFSLEIESNHINPTKEDIKITSTADISISAPSYVEAFLFSSSLGLFNISYVTYQNILISILHFYQVLLSAILILLSIARYINNDKTLSPQDERLYEIVALKNYIGTEEETEEGTEEQIIKTHLKNKFL